MARTLACVFAILVLSQAAAADLALTPKQVPAAVTVTVTPTTALPAKTPTQPAALPTTTPATVVVAGKGPAKLPAGLPANKVPQTAPKTVPRAKVAPPPEVTVACTTVAQNPPYRITTCSVTSKAKEAVCVKLNCNPLPGAPCLGGVPPVAAQGAWNPALAKPNQNCSWVVNTDCSSPTPLYPLTDPLKLEGQWGFGFMTPYQGNIAISVAKVIPAPDGVCEKPAAPVVPAVTPVVPAAKAPMVKAQGKLAAAAVTVTPTQVPAAVTVTVTPAKTPAQPVVAKDPAALPTQPATPVVATGKVPATLPTAVPGSKLPQAAPKVVPRPKAPAPEVTVACTTTAQNPPFRITTCSVVSKAKEAVCVKLNCDPLPGAPCIGGQPPVIAQGAWNPALAKPNQNCSWVLNSDCSSPTPLYPLPDPLKPEGQWGFGFMTPYQGNIAISVAKVTPAPDGVCEKPAAPVVPAVTPVVPAAKRPAVKTVGVPLK